MTYTVIRFFYASDTTIIKQVETKKEVFELAGEDNPDEVIIALGTIDEVMTAALKGWEKIR